MKAMKSAFMSVCVVPAFCGMAHVSIVSAADAQVPASSEPADADRFIPITRLFTSPTAEVLGSLDGNLSGGKAFSAEREHGFIGRASLGLGGVAEVEFSTSSALDVLRGTEASFPTSAFKMRVLAERGMRPAVAWMLRGTTSWQDIDGPAGAVYDTRLVRMHVIGTKHFGTLSVSLGLGWADVRAKDPARSAEYRRWEGELKRNLFCPFGGFSVQVNPRTFVMGDVEVLPEYNFSEELTESTEMIQAGWSATSGVRFYLTRWMATDVGVGYRSRYSGLADATIKAGVNVLVPLSEIRLR
jgi:hypothetical protein